MTIITDALRAGVSLALSENGNFKAYGDSAVVASWIPVLRKNKAAILKSLLEAEALSGDLAKIRKWLAFIGEHDPRCIAEVKEQCCADADARRYFVGRSVEVPEGDAIPSPDANKPNTANPSDSK